MLKVKWAQFLSSYIGDEQTLIKVPQIQELLAGRRRDKALVTYEAEFCLNDRVTGMVGSSVTQCPA